MPRTVLRATFVVKDASPEVLARAKHSIRAAVAQMSPTVELNGLVDLSSHGAMVDDGDPIDLSPACNRHIHDPVLCDEF